MNGIKHLSSKKIEEIIGHLWKVSSSLNGLGSLFRFQSMETCITPDEYAGLGYLLQVLSEEISSIEDTLQAQVQDGISKAE